MQKAFHRCATCLGLCNLCSQVTRSHLVTSEVAGSHKGFTFSVTTVKLTTILTQGKSDLPEYRSFL